MTTRERRRAEIEEWGRRLHEHTSRGEARTGRKDPAGHEFADIIVRQMLAEQGLDGPSDPKTEALLELAEAVACFLRLDQRLLRARAWMAAAHEATVVTATAHEATVVTATAPPRKCPCGCGWEFR